MSAAWFENACRAGSESGPPDQVSFTLAERRLEHAAAGQLETDGAHGADGSRMVQLGEHRDDSGTRAGLVRSPAAALAVHEGKDRDRVALSDPPQRLAAARRDRRDDELEPGLPERDGGVEGAAERIAGGVARLPEPPLLVEVVDGDEPARAAGISGDPVIAPGADGRVLDRIGLEAPAVGQGLDHGVRLEVAREIPHAQTISGRSVFRASRKPRLTSSSSPSKRRSSCSIEIQRS